MSKEAYNRVFGGGQNLGHVCVRDAIRHQDRQIQVLCIMGMSNDVDQDSNALLHSRSCVDAVGSD